MKTVVTCIAFLLVLLCIVFGHPADFIANMLWAESSAPWETVNAYYYPNKNDLSKSISQINIGTIQQCRDWAHAQASLKYDANLQYGDYECGAGCSHEADLNVCRITIK